jgi:hypothetical protein
MSATSGVTVSFVGRTRELVSLRRRLDWVGQQSSGSALAIRGRRQVGKSRLAQEFCDRAGVPYYFFTAVKGYSPVESVAAFVDGLRCARWASDHPALAEAAPGWWADAFRILADVLPERPSIVVIDELPWLSEQDQRFDGVLQVAWDRQLSRKPVLLLLLGSDVHMMERFTAYDRPFYGRADSLVLGPLTVDAVGQAVGLTGSDALDAQLVSGGLPGIVRTWPRGMPALDYLKQACDEPSSPVFGVPEAALLAEFPAPDQTRRVIEAVGSGERSFTNIAAAAGGARGAVASGTLSPILHRLVGEKGVLALAEPLSTQPGKPALYRIADSNLRLYLAMLREARDEVLRGRAAAAFGLISRRWTSWRGRAIEPLVREALEAAAIAGDLPWPDVTAVGGWWNRQLDPEMDIVGVDRAPIARQISFVGSIKWLGTAFDSHDLATLTRGAAHVPGFDVATTGLVAVSASGFTDNIAESLVLAWTPDDVANALRADATR